MVACYHGRRLQAVLPVPLLQECCSSSSETRVNNPVKCRDVAAPYAAALHSGHSACTPTFDRSPSSTEQSTVQNIILHCVQKKNTHSHFLSYLHE